MQIRFGMWSVVGGRGAASYYREPGGAVRGAVNTSRSLDARGIDSRVVVVVRRSGMDVWGPVTFTAEEIRRLGFDGFCAEVSNA